MLLLINCVPERDLTCDLSSPISRLLIVESATVAPAAGADGLVGGSGQLNPCDSLPAGLNGCLFGDSANTGVSCRVAVFVCVHVQNTHSTIHTAQRGNMFYLCKNV